MAELRAQAWQDHLDGKPEPDVEPPAWRTWYGRGRLWELFADHFDLTHQIAAGKSQVTPYPRTPTTKPRVLSIDELTDDMWG